ncbi:MAG: hypothetical protein LBT40_12475 [Deltaproteobacteria bacterium]|jgi:hypothetical protein|nr:hypothetical protein [Deltaproteobacteria bacterium]
MSDTIICPGCGAPIPPDPVRDDLACPKCGTVIPNPDAEGPEPGAISSMLLAADRVAEEAMPRVSAPSPGTAAGPPDGDGGKSGAGAGPGTGAVDSETAVAGGMPSGAADGIPRVGHDPVGTAADAPATAMQPGDSGPDTLDSGGCPAGREVQEPREVLDARAATAAGRAQESGEARESGKSQEAGQARDSVEAQDTGKTRDSGKVQVSCGAQKTDGTRDPLATPVQADLPVPGAAAPPAHDESAPGPAPAAIRSAAPPEKEQYPAPAPAQTPAEDSPYVTGIAAPDAPDGPGTADAEDEGGGPDPPPLPEDAVLAARGRDAMARSDLAAAEELFKAAAAVNPDSYEAWKGLADCVLQRPSGGVFRGLRMIDFLKADIKPSFVESALDPAERGKRVYLTHRASGAILAFLGPDVPVPPDSTRTVSAVILGPSIHRYGGFRHSAAELVSGKGRDVVSDWEGFRTSFAASQEALRTWLVNAARLAPKGREAELMMEYAFRFLDQPMAMADICAGGPRRAKDLRCYVATAVYGDPLAPEVAAWRRFRDRKLMPHLPGRALVRAYYALSPRLAELLSGTPALNRLARRALDALAAILRP